MIYVEEDLVVGEYAYLPILFENQVEQSELFFFNKANFGAWPFLT